MTKYRNIQTNGYASKKEANYAANLRALASSGIIWNLVEQMTIIIVPAKGKCRGVTYRADFVYTDSKGEHVVDVKGYRTALYQLKKKLLYLLKDIVIEEV